MTINDEIRKIRIKNGLSQKDLAAAIGLTQGYISGIEQGKKTLSVTLLDNIAKILGVDIAKLFPSEELDKEKVDIDNVEKIMSIVDNWIESNKLKINNDSRSELVGLLLEDHGDKTIDDKRIKKIERQILRIVKIVKSEKNEK